MHVTLAIVTRNRPECLGAALGAAQESDDPPDEVLVSDDSDDEVRPSVRAVCAGRPGIRYVEGPRRGLGANRNHAVAHLPPEAQWVVFTDDDARLFPDFVRELRRLLSAYVDGRRIPSGIEIRNGGLVRPNRLDFLGYQSRAHEDYSPGAPLETVVVQATAFPIQLLREVSWHEVSTYGYDEVDMAYKARRLGWQLVFEPSLRVHHDQSPVGRDDYPPSTDVARLYFRLRSYSVYARRPLALLGYLLIAPLHLLAVHLRRGRWKRALQAPSIVLTAYLAWLRSLRGDWRRC